jgi:hypothetical protein
MGKGANQQLLNNSGVAQGNNKNLTSAGSSISGQLVPQLEAEASNPQGYTPQQLAYMNTASQQSLGGGASATTGTANLTAARTRNAGGFSDAVGDADRSAEKQISQNALGIQTQQANLQQAQRQQALSALQQLYGVDEQTALGYLNSSNQSLNYENAGSVDANNDFWKSFNNIASTAAGAAAGAGGGGGGSD